VHLELLEQQHVCTIIKQKLMPCLYNSQPAHYGLSDMKLVTQRTAHENPPSQ